MASYNEVRMTPLSSQSQTVIESSLILSPSTATYNYVDYWGSLVYAFDIHEPHKRLAIISSALVETAAPKKYEQSLSWEDLNDSKTAELFAEYLPFTNYVSEIPELISVANELRMLPTPQDAAEGVCDFIRNQMNYESGSTSVSGTALDAWNQRSGVCQDFAHLALSLYRNLNIPSRYVSGYLYPNDDANVGDHVVGASHAWVEIWLGQWRQLDPTNGAEVGEHHITVAKGRDYADVTPFSGIYHGGKLDSLKVSVDLIRQA